jgi:6-pyruvoyltetrahydropterin/6-carboxytetrahydropterin synthase
MYILAVEKIISMAHQLNDYQGACARIHGHNWRFRVEISAKDLNGLGMAIDFIDLEKWLGEIVDPFDHNLVNQIPPFNKINPTAENLVKYIYDEMKTRIPPGSFLRRVTAWETDTCQVSYEE